MVEKLHLKRNSLSDEIIRVIQSQILEEKLKPGERLPSEKEMCDLFSVGRSTLREAIKALIIAGLLEKKKDGTYVKSNFDFIFKVLFSKLKDSRNTGCKSFISLTNFIASSVFLISLESLIFVAEVSDSKLSPCSTVMSFICFVIKKLFMF